MPTPASNDADHIIIGIDPGTNLMGYGILRIYGPASRRKLEMVTMGVSVGVCGAIKL